MAASIWFSLQEFGDNGADGKIEIEQATLVEKHCHWSGRNNFGDRSKVKKRTGIDGGCTSFVCETSESFESDNLPVVGDGDGSARERMLRNRSFQNRIGGDQFPVVVLDSLASLP